MRENQIFSIFPLFHPPNNFSSFHFFTPQTKRTLRVCLFGGEIGRMENFEEKIGRKTFLECVWFGREEGK